MGSEVPARPGRRRRTIAAAAGAALLMVLFVAGLAFANSIGAARVADNARRLHWANAALGTSSLTRAALVQASTALELQANGLATDDDVDFAMAQATAARTELGELEDEEIAGSMESFDEFSAFASLSADVLSALTSGDAVAAESLILGDMERAYESLSDELLDEQAVIRDEITDHTRSAARTNSYIVFALTFAIPAAAVATYWWVARGQVREYRIRAETELEAERSLGRAKDSFIAGLSHELRTPLTSIYGFAELLTEPGFTPPEQTPDVARIIADEAAELTRMVDDLLVAARLESTGVEIDLGPTSVGHVVHSALAPFAKAGVEIEHLPSAEVVVADAARLRHVLVNLLSNAVHHGGPEIGIEVSSREGSVYIEVRDNGPGVPEEKIDRLFQRFLHDGHETLLAGSVGLGLAVAHRLTELMEGELIYQRDSNDTRFAVRLAGHSSEDEHDADESAADEARAMKA